jgi:ketosteroid isomerase-like protein
VLETTIRVYAAAWAARDREAWLRTFATDATREDPVGNPVRRGHHEIGEFWDREMARYESIEIVSREIFVIGHEAAMDGGARCGAHPDIVVGSDTRFEDRGEHSLKRTPGEWRLFSLVD